MPGPRLLVTRPEPAAAGFAKAAERLGFDPVLEPLLRYRATDVALPDLDAVQAVLATSAEGVRAFAARTARRDLPLYAVGGATAAAARTAGFRDVAAAEGDGRSLADLAAAELEPAGGPLLHARGADIAFDLAAALADAGFETIGVVLYAAEAADALSPATRRLIRAGGIEYAAFFSPRSSRTFVRLANEAELGPGLAGTTAAALSANVAAPLNDLPWRRVLTAERPDAASLLQTLAASLRETAPSNGAS